MHRLVLAWLAGLAFVLYSHTAVTADFPELFNTEPESEDTWMAADEAAEKFGLPPGFRATAFASEPDVQNPIAMSWDSRGRLWVAENYTYAERAQRFQLDLRDRVVIFDGADGDKMTKRTVFTDNVQMLTGLEVGHDGVWLMCPPKLIFIPDRDHDDVPDGPGEVVLDGFEVAAANYHNFANGLRFGPDGWLYGRCGGSCPGRIGPVGCKPEQRLALEGGMWRYHVKSGRVEVLTTGTTNPWGHDWNRFGEAFFVNTVNGHLWHMIPGAHFARPFTLDPNGRTYQLIDFHADHWHFDTGGKWTDSRDGAANEFGGGHAHSGTMIYQGGRWPESYDGKLFTLNFHGRRANQEILERQGSGYVARHGRDMMIAADPWFRGMELSSGPDGNVFVLDWSDAGECHEHTGVHRTSGRIFKVISESSRELPTVPEGDIRDWTNAQCVAAQDHPNVWYLRQARLELARRHAGGRDLSDAIGLLRDKLDGAEDQRDAVQALLTLHLIGGVDRDFLVKQLSNEGEHVRAWAIRLLSETWPIDDALSPVKLNTEALAGVSAQADALLPKLVAMGQDDPSSLVRLTLASTLQRLPLDRRARLATSLVGHPEDADDHNLPLMIWYGLVPVSKTMPGELVAVARGCRLPTTLRLISRCLAEEMESHPDAINQLLTLASEQDDQTYRKIVLDGISEGLKGWRSAVKPAAWDALAAKATGAGADLVRELSVVFGDGRAMDELRAIALGKIPTDPEMRRSALATLIQSDPDDLRSICETLLRDVHVNVLAAQGLAKFDDPAIGASLVKRYKNFRAPQRPKVMSILVSRPAFAGQLLDAIESGSIGRSDLSAFQVRQIHSLADAELSDRVAQVWGEVRDTPAEKQNAIDSLKASLSGDSLADHSLADHSLAGANHGQGRLLFKQICQNCHKLYGEGAAVGPDLTGADRGNLDYLLSNIIDPSAVVSKDYRMSVVLLDDGRTVNGLVTGQTDRTIDIQTATEQVTIAKDEIVGRKVTDKSPMPDGLFDTLSPTQIRDLVGYLGHPSQVPLP